MPDVINSAFRMLNDYFQYAYDNHKRPRVLETEYANIQWQPFQQAVLDLAETKPGGRTLHWFHEPTGKVGKSHVTTHLACQKLDDSRAKAYCPDITKSADIFCGYCDEPVIILDVPRSQCKHMDHIYHVCKKFIDCRIFAGKYKSRPNIFIKPHVLVFSNEPPKYEINGKLTLSADRFNLVDLTIHSLKCRDDTPSSSKSSDRKRKEPESWKAPMACKDVNPMATKQTRFDFVQPNPGLHLCRKSTSVPTGVEPAPPRFGDDRSIP